MAAQTRNETEIEADRLFILTLRRQGGQAMNSVTQVARVLNEKRAAAAREFALALGKSDDEAEEAADAARLSVQTVRRDLRVVDERLRRASEATAAVWLDDQIADVQADIERTYEIDQQILDDLQRSRDEVHTQTEGVPQGERNIRTTRVLTRRRASAPASADLYQALIRTMEYRGRLRGELLRLRYGRDWFANRVEERNFVQSIVDLDDPEKAREAAMALYRREVEALIRTEKMDIGPMPPEVVQAERLRVQRLAGRIGAVRALIAAGKPDIPPNAPGSGSRGSNGSYELVVTRVSPSSGG